MSFRNSLSQYWYNVQYTLFPQQEEVLGELSADHKKLSAILELIRIDEFLPCTRFNEGRPSKDRGSIARAFVAKIVFKITYTKQLVKLLKIDKQLKSLCGWDIYQKIPSESKFSRAFKEFSQSSLPDKVHHALIKGVYKDQTVGHVFIDSTPIEVREKALKKESVEKRLKIKIGKKKSRRRGELNRRQKQLLETDFNEMIKDLPTACDRGMKKSSSGYIFMWKGLKVHAAVDDHCIPLAVIVTSASLNDCEVAIPLSAKCNEVTKNFYDVMDAAYDHPEIKRYSASLGHVPIIDSRPSNKAQKAEKKLERSRKKSLNFLTAEDRRYKERMPKERFNACYKDFNGGRTISYKGHAKVSCHVMFGVLTMAASMIINLLI